MIKDHADGGTYEVLQFAETRNGWGVAVTRWTTYRNTVVFEVMRCNADNKMIRMSHHTTEEAARSAANTLWKRDR